MGASLALNILTDGQTIARVNDGAGLTGGNNLNVLASSNRTVTSTVAAGSAAGVAVSPAVAISYVNNTTTAQLGTTSGSPLSLAGNATIQATHTGSTSATGDADAAGNKVAVGATIGVNIANDNTNATTNRDITAAGFVTIASQSTLTSTAEMKASTKGNDPNQSSNSDSQASSQTNNNLSNQGQSGVSLPKAGDQTSSASSNASSESGTGSGGVGVAAAIGVNWATSTNTASIGNGVRVTASGGPAKVSAANATSATAKATGTSLNLTQNESKVNVGAAVSLNVPNSHNSAIVGSNAVLTGHGITVEAVTPAASAPNTFIALGVAASGGNSQNGIAGSIGINVINLSAEANVKSGADLESSSGIVVNATSPIALQSVAASGAFATGNAVGAAVAINVVNNTTEAYIGNNGTANATGAIGVTATASIVPIKVDPGISVIPQSVLPTVTAGAISGAAGMGDAAVGGSVIVEVLTLNTHAYIGQSARINQASGLAHGPAQSITVAAQDDTTIQNGAGSLAVNVGGDVGFGIALDVEIINKNTYAYIGSSTLAQAGGDVTVQATSTEPIFSVGASAGVSTGTAGAAGAILVVVLDQGSNSSEGTYAYIDNGASVQASGSVVVAAADNADPSNKLQLYAGGLAFGSTAGVGLANTTLVKTLVLDAHIGQGANVSAKGQAGLAVTATTQENLTTIAVAGSGGGDAGLAGSATVNILNQTVHASIDQGATVDASQTGGSNPNSVQVIATDLTQYLGVAGALAIGGTAGIGAGVDVGVITKDTQAWVSKQATITANSNVAIGSVSSEQITSISAGAAGGGDVAVALNAGVSVLSPTTRAYIDGGPQASDGSVVTTDGSVTVTADEKTTMNVIAGNLAFSGSVSVGAAAGVPIVTKKTEAFLGQNVQVTAKGNAGPSTVATGLGSQTTPTTFDPQSAVQPDGSSINLGYTHGYSTGEAVYYYTDGGNDIGNLPATSPGPDSKHPIQIVYYAIVVNPTTIKLATSKDNANAGIAITGLDKTQATGNQHRIVPTTQATVQNVVPSTLRQQLELAVEHAPGLDRPDPGQPDARHPVPGGRGHGDEQRPDRDGGHQRRCLGERGGERRRIRRRDVEPDLGSR